MDLVYIVKESERNEDLRYSLRSIAKFLPDHKVWIVGYKPSWVQNVEYIPVKQNAGKWRNSVKNIEAACSCEEISEDFVLMNDDFFAIKPIDNLEKSIELCLGSLDKSVQKHQVSVGTWHKAFKYVYDLLNSLHIQKPYYDYESHTPLKVNRHKMLEVLNLPQVKKFEKTGKVLHKRTLYKNYCQDKCQTIPSDVKLSSLKDDTKTKMKVCDWISVYDNQVGDPKFKDLNNLLHTLFPEPCLYEDPTIKLSDTSKVYRTGVFVTAKSIHIEQEKLNRQTKTKKPRFGAKRIK